jgi:predicted DNA-binding helix-hairpin-helix protein
LSASAQSDDWDDFANEYMGEIIDEEEDNGREIYEELLEMHRQPVNINKATRDDLLRMPFLSDAQADSVLCLISRSHGLLSMGKLMFVRNLEYKQRRYLALFFFCIIIDI